MARQYIFYHGIHLRKSKSEPKVFCIGFIKTGTKSISYLLKDLGYTHLSFNPFIYRDFQNGEKEKLMQIVSKFDSFDDLPWNEISILPELDKTFPNSKFIYLYRESDEWLESFRNWSNYLTDNTIDSEKWLKDFMAHREFVYAYFENRDGYIEIDLQKDEDFKSLLHFLDKPSSLNSFPHINKTRNN